MEPHQIEAFALAADRAKALEQFIPESDDYFFYSSLQLEQAGRFKEIDALLKRWNERCGETAQFQEIRNRLALLKYESEPKKTLEYLRYHLGLEFDHERDVDGSKTKYPTKLDAKQVSRDVIRDIGNAHSNEGDLSGFQDAALEWLIEGSLQGDRLRAFLGRLTRPDYADLVDLVAAELRDKNTSGFGAIEIHKQLLQEQLDRLAKLNPKTKSQPHDLKNDERFVNAYLAKLQPGPDVDGANDPKEHEAHLDRLWTYVKGLPAPFNPLKAHVLFHRLDHDRKLGTYDLARFMEYVKMPRDVSYMNPDLRHGRGDEAVFSLGKDYRNVTMHAAVSSDEELVRDYLSRFFIDAKDYHAYDKYISTSVLKEVFATTKMLNGVGDVGQWVSMLNDPNLLQALKDRVAIGFARTNRTWFRAGEAVTLALDVKNVPTLVVKVFEINALNYFLANGRDVDTSVDLDGLVAGEEKTHTYAEPPIRSVRRSFSFPQLEKPGVFVVEFIGGGISSRALIRKGRLRFVERAGSAGHVFTVLDEDRKLLKDASIWLGGREYKAEEDGSIRIPFSTNPGRQSLLLRHGDVTTLETFHHQAERIHFTAGIYVDRESLVKKKEAQVLLRPVLQIAGAPAALELIEEPTLVIQSTDREGVGSSMEVRDFKLHADKESVHAFQVPENLASITFMFRGKIQNISEGRKIDLAESRSFQLNAIDAEAAIEGLHLGRAESGYVLYLLGKSGEAKAGVPLSLNVTHRDLVPTLDFSLQTDASGRVELGHLRDITSISASAPSGAGGTWGLPHDRSRLPGSIHVREGEMFRVPCMDIEPLGGIDVVDELGRVITPEVTVERTQFSLLERIGSTFVRDHFKALSRSDGYLDVAGLPAGDYELHFKRNGTSIVVRVAPGEDRLGWVAGAKRHLERQNAKPLQISGVKAGKTAFAITLGNAGKETRVHVFGTRFLPAYSSFDELGRVPPPAARTLELFKGASHYVSGRDIGDEYRYILERKYSKKFAGNTLARPGLLLNPWAVRTTETATQDARGGEQYAQSPPPAPSVSADTTAEPVGAAEGGAHSANLDFLANAAAALVNLKPDDDGIVTVPRDAVAHASQLRIVAVDLQNTVCRDFLLPEAETAHQDLRLRLALDPEKHYTEKKQVSVLSEGQPLEIADITTSKTEVYDTLARVFRLFSTLSGNATLQTFGFIVNWPKLPAEEKRAKYSEFACHELSFFLSKKDPAFFKDLIQPYLRNKKDRTFMDRFLLDEDLSEYRKPWAFGRLNIIERILLGRRFDDEGDPVARHVNDLNDLLPRNVEEANRLFTSAIQGSALEAGDALGIADAVEKAEQQELDRHPMREMMSPGAASGAMAKSMPAPAMAAPRSAKPADMKKMKMGRRAEAESEAPSEEGMMLDEARSRDDAGGDYDDGSIGRSKDASARSRMRQFYQKVDKTQEWAENNYYHLPIEQQVATLVTVNAFWVDYAKHRHTGPFLSANIACAARSFTEMMCALAVLDLPFETDKPEVTFQGAKMKYVSKRRSVAYHKEIKPAKETAERVPVLVSQNYFRDDDRTRYEGSEEHDRYVTGEFLVNVVYACQVVLTNPTSSDQKLDLLLQIPPGAVPVKNGFYTRGVHAELSSYDTESFEYAFYFPSPGTFAHFPVHVSKDELLVAAAEPTKLKVVRELSTVDKTSWAWLSQHGDAKEVLKWMDENNIDRLATENGDGEVTIERIAWRMRDRGFYEKCIALLQRRHVYNETLWAYAVQHDDAANIRELLLHRDSFLDQCGLALQSSLLRIDPVLRHRYQHLEYAPLINARTQKLGARRTILNNRFAEQHGRFMTLLRYRARLSDDDLLGVAYYLFLADRVDEALETFDRVNGRNVQAKLQYEYLGVYGRMFKEQPDEARGIAERYKDHPVDKWRNLFRNALSQIDEISGKASKVVDEKDRDQRQAKLASTEPDFEFSVEKKTVTVTHQNLAGVLVNYYRMDIELLFSRQPFVQQQSGQFAFIRPNAAQEIKLSLVKNTTTFQLPAEFHGANVIVEIVADGKRKSQACYAHELLISVRENYGQVRVAKQETDTPLSKTYIKVYARMKSGEVKFYKDGYTDLRGVFEYASLSTNELDFVERFSILILSESQGAVIREAAPPKR